MAIAPVLKTGVRKDLGVRIPRPPFRKVARWYALGAVFTIVACAGYAKPDVPDYERWTRDSFHLRRGRCSTDRCSLALRGSTALDADTRKARLRPHEIPGWDNASRSARVAGASAQTMVRAAGGFSERTIVELGESAIVSREDTAYRARCRSLTIVDEAIVKDASGTDQVSRSVPRVHGIDCRVVSAADSGRVLWRFRYGITPPRDSLAALYDSLVAAGSPLVTAQPPVSLERLAGPGSALVSYRVARDPRAVPDLLRVSRRFYVNRESGEHVGVIDLGLQATAHASPDATTDERSALRLFAAGLLVQP